MTENQLELSKLIVGFLMPAITTAVFIFGVYQYRRAQRWKRQEFLAIVIKNFFDDFYVGQALLMLDWHEHTLKYYPDSVKTFNYNRDELGIALETEDFRREKNNDKTPMFNEYETVIRKSFDKLFYYFASFQCHIENDLYKQKDIEPYIIYYLRILGDKGSSKRLNPETINNLMLFLEFYDYVKVKLFLQRFNIHGTVKYNNKHETKKIISTSNVDNELIEIRHK